MPTVFKIGIWNAWLFMSVFIFQMIVIFFIDKQAWKRSHVPDEASRNRLESYAGIAGNIVWLVAMIYSVFLPFRLGTVWFYVGLTVFLIGLLFITIATCNFISTPEQLITKGVYRFSRHPMYLASFFICLGSGMAGGSWLFVLLSLMLASCFYLEALVEEKYLLSVYGNAYEDYMTGTPRVLGIFKK
ncbi:MAG TPA: isoprenylcysteine carboxylmethyltransferase family protein [Patescibacteria group bacterium]|nr:isoprenylcysteine carboxylmethyltransferase family protein [Patescibacteria group bacterium]